MLLTRKKLRLLLYEMLLLERLSKQELIGKIRYLDAYSKYLDKLNAKYYDALDRLISEYDAGGNTDVAHGAIIFMLSMHQKYASTNVLPNEHKDYNQMNLENLKGAIEGIGAQYTDGALYGELVELDKKQSELKVKDDEEEEPADETNTSNTNINREVRPGLFLLGVVDGWQIHKPTTVAGSQAFGVQSWCTVYSDAFVTYKNSGITLYYLCKDGKDYDESGYGFDYQSKPYDYVCIGFEEDDLAIPSDDYSTSVWGNQEGVTYDKLNKIMGSSSSDKIIDLITKHFRTSASLTSGKGSKDFLKRKLAKAAATIPRALKSIARNKGPDDTFILIKECLDHPKLNDVTLEYIFKKYYLKIDSKMRKTEAYTSGVYKTNMLKSFLGVHTIIPEGIRSILASEVLEKIDSLVKYLGGYGAKSFLTNAGLWAKELSPEFYEKLFNMLRVEKIQTFDRPEEPLTSTEEYLFDIFEKIFSHRNHALPGPMKTLEEMYHLGKFDEVVHVYINNSVQSSRKNPNYVPTYDTRYGRFATMLDEMLNSPYTSSAFKGEVLDQKIEYALKAPLDELEWSGNPYKAAADVENHNSKELAELSQAALRLNKLFDKGSVQGTYMSREILRKVMKTEEDTPIKQRLSNLFKEYVDTHNRVLKLADDAAVQIPVKSEIYRVFAETASFFPAEEMRSLLQGLGGITHENDYYFIHTLIDNTREKRHSVDHKVEIYDMTQEMLNKHTLAGQDESDKKNLKLRLSRLAYGGYNGGAGQGSGNNAELCYQLLKSQPEIFFTCMEYHYRYADAYDSAYFPAEWHKILNALVENKKITYQQALKDVQYINEKFYERAVKFTDPDNKYRLKSFEDGVLSANRIVDRSEEIDVDED